MTRSCTVGRHYRRPASHVADGVGAGPAVPTPVRFWPATRAGSSRAISGPETMVKLLRDCWLNCTQCCRKTCLTSAKERDNAWLRELIGRLSLTRAVTLSRPTFLAQAQGRWPTEFG